MKIIPVSQKLAKEFVTKIHRHHKAGALQISTLEINRTCVLDEKKTACSMLMGAACRAGKALGYSKIITYTLAFESGRSLHGAGFIPDKKVKKKLWTTASRPRQTALFQEYDKIRWIRILRNTND